jgi:protein-tyrosine phosphatase
MRDEHCHIIWGVDDGSDSFDMTREMVKAAMSAGIDEIVCTPHMRWSDFDKRVVQERFARLSSAVPSIKWTLGYEVYYKRLLEIGIEHAPEFTIGDTNMILLEFNSGAVVPDDWQRVFYKLQSTYGLDITLAHPERYATVLENFDIVYQFADMGIRMQVSAGDLYRGMFDKGTKCAKRLIKEGLCDAVVSDAHCPEHYEDFARAVKKWG